MKRSDSQTILDQRCKGVSRLAWTSAALFLLLSVAAAYTQPKLRMPIPNGAYSQCTEGNHDSFSHTGKDEYALDFDNQPNTPGDVVVAAQSGRAYVRTNTGYGTNVRIDHGGGFYTLYAHLASTSIANDVDVSQGQQIGVIGGTGRTPPWPTHLHFMMCEGDASASTIAQSVRIDNLWTKDRTSGGSFQWFNSEQIDGSGYTNAQGQWVFTGHVYEGGDPPPDCTTPGTPNLTQPDDWQLFPLGTNPMLCAERTDGTEPQETKISVEGHGDSGWMGGNCWTPEEPGTLPSGSYVWHAKKRNSCGEGGEAMRAFRINYRPGKPNLLLPANNAYVNTRTVELSWSDPGDPDNLPLRQPNNIAYREYCVNRTNWGGETGWAGYTSTSMPLTAPSDGNFGWQVKASDGLEDDGYGGTSYFTVDTVAPSISLSPADWGGWYYPANRQDVCWGASDSGLSTVEVWWDGSGPSGVGASGCLEMLEGSHVFNLRATDHAGNQNSTSRTYRLDTVAPSISLTGPTTSHWFNKADGAQSVTWGATDGTSDVATKTLTWDSGAATSASPAQIPEGRRTATVSATDNAGNPASQPYGPWWIDTTPPNVSASLYPASPDGQNGWHVSIPTLTVSASDPNGSDGSGLSGVYYTFDSSPEAAYVTPVPIAEGGIHTFSGRAADSAGNSRATSTMTVKVDTTVPISTDVYTDPESGSLSTLVATWSFSDGESGVAEYEYSIGTSPGDNDVRTATIVWTGWAYATNLNLTPGQSYYFTVRAKNVAGLWSDPVTSRAILAVDATHDQCPVLSMGGTSVPEEARASDNYRMVDTLGQFVVSTSESDNYVIEHGYWHSDFVTPVFTSVGLAKALEDGKPLQLGTSTDPVIATIGTGVFSDRFYVEQQDRTSGIAVQYGVLGGPTLTEGDKVWLTGKINTISGERILQFGDTQVVGHLEPPLSPLFMPAKSIGGISLNTNTPGVRDGVGLNNIGLLIKTFGGEVTYVDSQHRFFYIEDGSGLFDGSYYGIRVICDGLVGGGKLTPPAYGKKVTVTGISTTAVVDNQAERAIRPRKQSDIVEIN